MAGKLKKLVRGSKGMEALQSVMLLGAGFVVVWGLMAVWEDAKKQVQPAINSTITGNQTGAQPAKG